MLSLSITGYHKILVFVRNLGERTLGQKLVNNRRIPVHVVSVYCLHK